MTTEQRMSAAISDALWQIAIMREIMDALSDRSDENSREQTVPGTWVRWFSERFNAVGEALDRSRWEDGAET